MIADNERREMARKLRKCTPPTNYRQSQGGGWAHLCDMALAVGFKREDNPTAWEFAQRLADLIEPSRKPDADYDRWYNNLVSWAVNRDEPATIREIIKEIIWITLTVDLGPNGNTDPSTGIDEGMVYTNGLIDEWELAIKRLCGNCDRDALLALADEMEQETGSVCGVCMGKSARRIRKALGVDDD